jgi:hypothetical protein
MTNRGVHFLQLKLGQSTPMQRWSTEKLLLVWPLASYAKVVVVSFLLTSDFWWLGGMADGECLYLLCDTWSPWWSCKQNRFHFDLLDWLACKNLLSHHLIFAKQLLWHGLIQKIVIQETIIWLQDLPRASSSATPIHSKQSRKKIQKNWQREALKPRRKSGALQFTDKTLELGGGIISIQLENTLVAHLPLCLQNQMQSGRCTKDGRVFQIEGAILRAVRTFKWSVLYSLCYQHFHNIEDLLGIKGK